MSLQRSGAATSGISPSCLPYKQSSSDLSEAYPISDRAGDGSVPVL